MSKNNNEIDEKRAALMEKLKNVDFSHKDLNHKNSDFTKAIANNDIATVKELISVIDPSFHNNNSIQEAASNNKHEILKILLADPRVDPTVLGNMPFRDAVKEGHLESVALLLSDPRVDPTACDDASILEAVNYGRYAITELLLKDGRCDPNQRDSYPIRISIRRGYYKIIKLLLTDSRVDPSASDNSLLFECLDDELYPKENKEILELIWRYKTVRDKLKLDHINTYNKLKKELISEKIDKF
jgi:hypothetical protein